jgi:hypothetical protein
LLIFQSALGQNVRQVLSEVLVFIFHLFPNNSKIAYFRLGFGLRSVHYDSPSFLSAFGHNIPFVMVEYHSNVLRLLQLQLGSIRSRLCNH